MKQKIIRAVATVLAITACIFPVACAKEEEKKTADEKDTATLTLTADEAKTEAAIPAETAEQQDTDILEFCRVCEAMAGKGSLTQPDSYKVIPISSEADLEAYRHLFLDLSDEDAKTFATAEGAKTVIVEITGRQSNCTYAFSAVERADGVITLFIDETEEDVDQPEHSFLLLFIPDEYYSSETISVVFTD